MQLTRQRQARDGGRAHGLVPADRQREPTCIISTGSTRNRDRVTRLTGGQVGYLHIPDMGADGIREFIKWFYPQMRKEGLVVDVRDNGGGNVSQMLIERLQPRSCWRRDSPRTSDTRHDLPGEAFNGHLVALLNENSAVRRRHLPGDVQAGEARPADRQAHWGGVVGITDRGPLIDGGKVFVPEFGFANAEGRVDHRRPRRRSRHRGRERPEGGDRRADPQLERRGRGGLEEGPRTTEATPRSPRPAGEDPVMTGPGLANRTFPAGMLLRDFSREIVTRHSVTYELTESKVRDPAPASPATGGMGEATPSLPVAPAGAWAGSAECRFGNPGAYAPRLRPFAAVRLWKTAATDGNL